jgi:hypothetical protein
MRPFEKRKRKMAKTARNKTLPPMKFNLSKDISKT